MDDLWLPGDAFQGATLTCSPKKEKKAKNEAAGGPLLWGDSLVGRCHGGG